MPYKLQEYEMVTASHHTDQETGSVRGWDETGTIYDVRLSDGETLQVSEENLQTTDTFDVPFRYNEVVEIHPVRFDTYPELSDLIGKRGVVTGDSAPIPGGYWGFSVIIQSGEVWYLEENELKNVGITLSEEQLHGSPDSFATVRLHYNSETEEETVVSGDASLLKRGPIPLITDLDAL